MLPLPSWFLSWFQPPDVFPPFVTLAKYKFCYLCFLRSDWVCCVTVISHCFNFVLVDMKSNISFIYVRTTQTNIDMSNIYYRYHLAKWDLPDWCLSVTGHGPEPVTDHIHVTVATWQDNPLGLALICVSSPPKKGCLITECPKLSCNALCGIERIPVNYAFLVLGIYWALSLMCSWNGHFERVPFQHYMRSAVQHMWLLNGRSKSWRSRKQVTKSPSHDHAGLLKVIRTYVHCVSPRARLWGLLA